MNKKLKVIVSTLIIIIISILEITSISQAADYNKIKTLFDDEQKAIGKTIGTIGREQSEINLYSSNYLYCVERFESAGEGNTYTVKNYIDIEGNNAKVYNSSNSNPTTFVNNSNAILAYILGGGDKEKGFGKNEGAGINPRQLAVWMYWNTWAESAKGSLGNLNYTHNGNNGITERTVGEKIYNEAIDIINAAQAYSSENSGSKASIKMVNGQNNTTNLVGTYDDRELIGPIKLNFEGILSKITIRATDNSEINEYEIYDKNKNKLSGLESIKPDNEFYIKNTSKTHKVQNISFSVTASQTIRARIYIIENERKHTQRLIIADANMQNAEDSLTIKVARQEEGNIKLHKQDASTATALQGAEFKIFIGTKNEPNHWLAVDRAGQYVYTANYENAKTFTSDSQGNIVINNLRAGYKISIYETKAPDGYDLKLQKGYDEANNRVWCNQKYYTITTNTQDDTIILPNSKTGDIEITKLDTSTQEKLTGAEFKISVKAEGDKTKNTWLKKNNDGTYSYDSNFNNATAFKSTDGTCKIEDLDPGTYFIYEVTAPKGYNKTAQDNYDASNDWVKCGSTQVSSGKAVRVSLNNTKYINLEGYVWIEKPGSKANEYNDIYDDGEEVITDKVTITLRNKSDNKEIATATIDNARKVYRFEKLDYSKLKDYYVYFDYSKDYKDYITVTSNFDIARGSKALSDNVPDYDKDLIGAATTYKGSAYEAKYGLSGLANKFYNESNYTLENVNLGIKSLPATPFTVSENLAYVDVKIKGYNYRYIYGGTGAKLQTVPTVKFQSKTDKESYTRDIYPSDIVYENPQDKTQELQMYATYRVDVTNNTQIDVPYLYQERTLNVTRVLNKFDTSRYELQDNNWEATNSADVVQMKQEYLQKQYYDDYSKTNGISNESEKNNKYAYITFKVKPEAIKGVLKVAEGTIEDFPTTAAVTAYHKYTRIDSSWENNLTKTQTHYTRETTQTDSAPYILLKQGKNRTISGKVFEDKNTRTNGELVGNGMYDQNENKVQGVTVELGNYSNNEFVPTNLYKVDSAGNPILANNNEYVKASMKTTEKEGKYEFVGVVPGEYFLRFTYGDGTQKIVDLNGKEVKNISSNEYKSTIVTDEIRKVFETKYDLTKATWYIGMAENHNLAVDNLEERKAISDGNYTVTAQSLQNRKSSNITAQTPEFSVPVEFTQSQEGSATEQYPNELGYMDFGIIETPKTRLNLGKKITNIKVTDQQGKVVIEGNPSTQQVAYTTDLDKKTNGGSTYVKIEMDNVYGGTLEIKYEIEVTNNSDLDYMEAENDTHYGYYYRYGIKDYAIEKKIEISKVYDYLDPKLSYTSKEGSKEVKLIDISEFRNKEDNSTEQKEIISLVKAQEEATDLNFSNILEITNWNELYSSKGQNKDKSSDKVIINANKKLTTAEDDLEFINIAEVIGIKTEPITVANVEFPERANTKINSIAITPTVRLTVTPPTGGNRNIVYFAVGAIALAVLAGGVAVFNKKA